MLAYGATGLEKTNARRGWTGAAISSGVGGGSAGGSSTPPKVWFVKNPCKISESLGKILENLGWIPENPDKTPENSGKIIENLSKNGAQR